MPATTIQWTDFSTNPIRAKNKETGKIGHFCVKISPGCKGCYASKLQTPYLTQLEYIAENREKVEVFLDDTVLDQVVKRRKPTKFFWCDMTDMFGEWVPDEWIYKCLAAMALTPQHTHQVLTKRSRRMLDLFSDMGTVGEQVAGYVWDIAERNKIKPVLPKFPLSNVWLGVSVEDQQRADERIPDLLRTPAAVRFVSYEPALGPVDFFHIRLGETPYTGNSLGARGFNGPPIFNGNKLNWIIAGYESGPRARPAKEEWIRSVKDQCVTTGAAFFYKQSAINGRKIGTPELDGQKWIQFPGIANA